MKTMGDLEEQLEILQEENRQLRDALIGAEQLWIRLKRCFRLPGGPMKLLAALLTRDMVSRESFMVASARPDGEMPMLKTADVYATKLRKVLKPIGVSFETVWGCGFAMDGVMRDRVWRHVATFELAKGLSPIDMNTEKFHQMVKGGSDAEGKSEDQGSA
jgi:hypothetical protein